MIILGIETATSLCGVGLAGESGLIADYRLIRGFAHAEQLAGAAQKILTDAEIQFQDLSGVAISIGPGSFTGLRIGLGFAKGLAFSHDLSLMAVPTLTGLVIPIPPLAPTVCALLVARKGEVYRGVYIWQDAAWHLLKDVDVVSAEAICDGLPDGDVLFIGPGALIHREVITACGRAIFLDDIYSHPTGYGVASVGRKMLAAGEMADIDSLVPTYLKRFQGVA